MMSNLEKSETVNPSDAIAASVFSRIQEIIGTSNPNAEYKSTGVKHISVEEALKELLELQRATLEHPQASSQ